MAQFIEHQTSLDLEYQSYESLYNPDKYNNIFIFCTDSDGNYHFDDHRLGYTNYFEDDIASKDTYEEDKKQNCRLIGIEEDEKIGDTVLKIQNVYGQQQDGQDRKRVIIIEKIEDEESENYIPKVERKQRKTKAIYGANRNRRDNRRPNKKKAYPTKNFLPTFRGPFLKYLSPHFPTQWFQNLQIVRRIRGKACINLGDYIDLFNVQQFRPDLEQYFRNKILFRDLMQSRISFTNKIQYMKRLYVFQKAFNQGKFQKINEKTKN